MGVNQANGSPVLAACFSGACLCCASNVLAFFRCVNRVSGAYFPHVCKRCVRSVLAIFRCVIECVNFVSTIAAESGKKGKKLTHAK